MELGSSSRQRLQVADIFYCLRKKQLRVDEWGIMPAESRKDDLTDTCAVVAKY